MGLVKEFREFALKGNVMDMAVGIIIGAAFGTIVKTLVDKVLMPPLGLLMGGIDFADKKLVLKEGTEAVVVDGAQTVAPVPEVAMYYGEFINAVINFTIVAFAIFVMIKLMNNARKRFEKEQAAATTPEPGPAAEVVLLTEIRDLLQAQK